MDGKLFVFSSWKEASEWMDKNSELGIVFYSWFDGRRYMVKVIDRRAE